MTLTGAHFSRQPGSGPYAGPVPPDDPYELAMFPLGQVLFPGLVLPLHVFEPRYRALFATIVDAPVDEPHAGEFGVVLIERGSEVGGGDVRSDVGTVAQVVRAETTSDGRWGIVAVGRRRIRVTRWLDDDPWPRALVADWPDDEGVDTDALAAASREVRRALALAIELGDSAADPTFDLAGDPTVATYQLAALAPLGPFDQQHLLGAEGANERLATLRSAVADQVEIFAERLRLGDGSNG